MTNSLKNCSQFIIYLIFIWPLKHVFGLEIYGLENIKVRKPLVAIANHQSMWDSFAVLSAMGLTNFRKTSPWRSPIAKSLYRLPWVHVGAMLMGLYKIEPKGDLDKSLQDTFSFIDKGFSIFFFPSGKRLKKGEVAEPKKGVGYIAQKKDVYFLPVRIIYKDYTAKGFGKLRGAKIIFGEIFDSAAMRQKHAAETLHIAITERIFALEDNAKPKIGKLTTEAADGFSPELLDSILKIEENSFPPEWEYDDAQEYYTDFLNNKNNIVIVLRNNGKFIGHILAKPHDDAYVELKDDDPLMKEDADRYYIETMAILPEYRGGYGYLDLTKKIIEEAKRRGKNKFSMHIRKSNGLSGSFQKLFGQDVTEFRNIEKWKWANGEPYDYIEAVYTKSLLRLKLMIWSYRIYRNLRRAVRKIFAKKAI